MTTFEIWMCVGTFVSLLVAVGALAVAIVQVNKKQQSVITPQPLMIELKKTLHEEFASRRSFEDLVKHNTDRHGQLFNKIDQVERQARQELDRRMADLGEDRKATLERLTEQFTFIRENISAINRELQIRRES